MLKLTIAIMSAAILLYGGLYWFIKNPILFASAKPVEAPKAQPERLKAHVEFLAASNPARAYHNVDVLNGVAELITAEFIIAGCAPERHTFQVGGNDYHNIVCALGPADGPRIVIGAHYDVAGDNNPGADDNASAVAAILELARMIQQAKPDLTHRIDLVAFSLEEPPNFRSSNMGSYVYAKRLTNEGVDVKLMISVEMIGYFSDEAGSQQYPLPMLKAFYPDEGNFIGVVGQSFDRSLVARVKALMRVGNSLPVHSINAPVIVPGIDFSDHWGFWQHGLPAVMVTDTAFLRNPNYHKTTDTPETLDYERMGKVVDGLYQVAVQF